MKNDSKEKQGTHRLHAGPPKKEAKTHVIVGYGSFQLPDSTSFIGRGERI
jgi:hypothetical protein